MKYLCFLIFVLPQFLLAQEVTDSTVSMVAFWEMGDTAIYKFTSTEIKIKDGKRKTKTDFYDIEMTVLDSTADNYEIQWAYSNGRTDYKQNDIEKQSMEINQQLPSIIRTDEFGTFETIANWKEMQVVYDSLITEWLEQPIFSDTIKTQLRKTFNGMFESEAQVNFWASEIRIFLSSYGYSYDRINPQEYVKYYSNAFIDKRMPGTEKFTVVEVDEEIGIAKMEILAGLENEKVKLLMLDYISQNLDKFGLKSTDKLSLEDMPTFEVTEKIEFTYHLYSGYILDFSSIKTVKADLDTTIKKLQFELSEEE